MVFSSGVRFKYTHGCLAEQGIRSFQTNVATYVTITLMNNPLTYNEHLSSHSVSSIGDAVELLCICDWICKKMSYTCNYKYI